MASDRFNPHAVSVPPLGIGMEWWPTRERHALISSQSKGSAVRFTATTGDFITEIDTYGRATTPLGLGVEVYEYSDVDAGLPRLGHRPDRRYNLPAGDIAAGGWGRNSAATNLLDPFAASVDPGTVRWGATAPSEISYGNVFNGDPLINGVWTLALRTNAGSGTAEARQSGPFETVTAGANYVFAAKCRRHAGAPNGAAQCVIKWFTGASVFISESTGDVEIVTAGYTTFIYVSAVAPPTAAIAQATLRTILNPTTDWVFFDEMMLSPDDDVTQNWVPGGQTAGVVTSTDLYQAVDDGAAYSEGDWIQTTGQGFNRYQGILDIARTNGNVPEWAGKRILGVKLYIAVKSAGGSGELYAGFSYGTAIGEKPIGHIPDPTEPGGAAAQLLQPYWPTNPITSRPWTAHDIELLNLGGGYTLRWFGGNALATSRVYAVYGEVAWVEETRRAYGVVIPSTPNDAVAAIPVSTPHYRNMLSAGQSSAEGGDVEGISANNAGVLSATTRAFVGSRSIWIAGTGGTVTVSWSESLDSRDAFVVRAGQPYAFSVRAEANTVVRSVQAGLHWYAFDGTLISTVLGTAANDVVEIGVFSRKATVAGTAPAGAFYAIPFLTIASVANGESHFLDAAMFTRGSDHPGAFILGGAQVSYWEKHGDDDVWMEFQRGNEDAPFSSYLQYRLADVFRLMPLGYFGYESKHLNYAGFDTGIVVDTGEAVPEIPAFWMRTTSLVLSLDGQPYTSLDQLPYVTVRAGQTLEQEFTPDVTLNGVGVFVMAVRTTEVDPSIEPLVLKIKRRSDGVQVGSTAIIAYDDLSTVRGDSPRMFQIVAVAMAGVEADLIGGVQYYVEASSSEASLEGWLCLLLNSLPALNDVSGLGFGGTTDRASTTILGDLPHQDLAFYVATPAPDLAVFIAVPSTSGSPHATLSWGVPVDPHIAYVQVQRQRADTGWDDVARETSLLDVIDGGAPMGRTAQYRARIVRDDYSVGPWLTAEAEIGQPDWPCGCPLSITAPGVDPSLWVNVHDVNGGITEWERPDDLVVRDLDGSDDSVAFRSGSNRPDRFTIAAVVYGTIGIPTPVEGRAAFDKLDALIRADAPYITVRDANGNVWNGALRLGTLTETETGIPDDGLYAVTIEVTGMTRTPALIP